MNQIKLHKKTKEVLSKKPEEVEKQKVLDLMPENNFDAKNYFFEMANNCWIDWLFNNGFFDVLKKPAKDQTKLSYSMPELDFLVRMAETESEKVTAIINSIEISKNNFNPEVVDRFLWIISKLPAEQIKNLVDKIRDEKWVYLMRNFRQSTYQYEGIIKKLKEAGDDESILIIAEAILQVKNKQDLKERSGGIMADNPFCIEHISNTQVFNFLTEINKKYLERALSLVIKVMGEVVETNNENKGEIFGIKDNYHLFDVDFFELDFKEKKSFSHRDDVRNLATAIKKLIEKIIGEKCDDEVEIKRLFNKYILTLPDSRSMWRLKLFVMSLCPKVFEVELKNSFFRLFDVMENGKSYYEIISGTEYEKTLRKGFAILSDNEKQEYIGKVIRYFKQKNEEKKNEKENWHLKYGSRILSVICEHLSPTEKETAEKMGFIIRPDYEPESTISQVTSGEVKNISPVKLSDFTVKKIIENLGNEWTPKKFKEKYKKDDFFAPRGVEGLAEELKKDFQIRTAEYTKLATDFFDREKIHSHYIYSFLRAIEEMLRDDNFSADINWKELFNLFEKIKDSGRNKEFESEREESGSWLADWVAVQSAIADILLQAIGNGDDKIPFDFGDYRKDIFDLIKYLFTINDPTAENEKSEYGDLMTIAINSVKGRAFQVFTQFIYHDGKENFKKEDKIKIQDDVKIFYEKLLENEKSLAVRFMFGHYLASFYYRDREWVKERFSKIFLMDGDQMASWEGYLNSSVYKELFEDLQDFYSKAIDMNEPDYIKDRKLSKPIDEILSVHLALAFIYFEDFDFKHPLFIKFWKQENPARQKEFFSFIGRNCLSQNEAGDQWFAKNKVNKKKILNFWDWLIANKDKYNSEVFSGFGFWINPTSDVIGEKENKIVEKIAKTIKESAGDINWDYGLIQRLPDFAQQDPKNTISIIENYLLDKNKEINQHRGVPMFHIDNEIKEAIDIIYKANENLRTKIENLINILIKKGSSTFWSLEDILK